MDLTLNLLDFLGSKLDSQCLDVLVYMLSMELWSLSMAGTQGIRGTYLNLRTSDDREHIRRFVHHIR